MAFDETLALRVRAALSDERELLERKMFGGLCFMVRGHMCAGIVGEDLMLRVGPAAYEGLLKKPGARPMDFTGRPLTGLIYVAPTALRTDAALRVWLARAQAFVASLPPAKPKPKPKLKPKLKSEVRAQTRTRTGRSRS